MRCRFRSVSHFALLREIGAGIWVILMSGACKNLRQFDSKLPGQPATKLQLQLELHLRDATATSAGVSA